MAKEAKSTEGLKAKKPAEGRGSKKDEGPKKTPEEKAARKAKREEKLAAMSPAERKVHEEKKAKKKAEKGK